MKCIEVPYGIKSFKYIPSKSGKNDDILPKTNQDFKDMIWKNSKKHLDKYPLWFQKEFVQYWLQVPDCSDKNRYFMLSKSDRKKWSTLGRMATVKRTIYARDKRWQTDVKQVYVAPKNKKIDYGRIDPEKAKERLREQSKNKIMGAGERVKRNW